jgi:hypothetical protein
MSGDFLQPIRVCGLPLEVQITDCNLSQGHLVKAGRRN